MEIPPPIPNVVPSTAPSPIKFKQGAVLINGIHTEVVCSAYANQVMVVLTQLGSPGKIIHGEQENAESGGTSYEIRTLSGGREDGMDHVVARQILQSMNEAACEKSLLLCLGVSPKVELDRPSIKAMLSLVEEHRVW